MDKVVYLDDYRRKKEECKHVEGTQLSFDFPLKGKPMNKEHILKRIEHASKMNSIIYGNKPNEFVFSNHGEFVDILNLIISEMND